MNDFVKWKKYGIQLPLHLCTMSSKFLADVKLVNISLVINTYFFQISQIIISNPHLTILHLLKRVLLYNFFQIQRKSGHYICLLWIETWRFYSNVTFFHKVNSLTPSLWRPFKPVIFFSTAYRTACKHAFRFFESFAGSCVNTPLVAVTNVG